MRIPSAAPVRDAFAPARSSAAPPGGTGGVSPRAERRGWVLAATGTAVLGALIGSGLAGCDRKPGFRSTDITGADFAKGFQLTDHRGRPTRLEDFAGKLLVVFFGYTQCPDVCPTTMAGMADVMRRLGPLSGQVRVAFVTVDPERDTQELLSHYVPAFHPEFIGLWGDAEATERTARAFRIVYQKAPGKTPGSYTVDHSAGSYVFDRHSRVRLLIRHAAEAEAIETDLRRLLDER